MMLKQAPISRSLRTRGFKVKHALQICLLLAISIWLLYQVNRSRYNNEDSDAELTEEIMRTEINPIIKFGRKELNNPRSRDHDLESRKKEEKEEDAEDSKVEEISAVEGRGGGDDEIDGNDQEKAEEEDSDSELEDFIDEEDREKEEPSMEEESDEKAESDVAESSKERSMDTTRMNKLKSVV